MLRPLRHADLGVRRRLLGDRDSRHLLARRHRHQVRRHHHRGSYRRHHHLGGRRRLHLRRDHGHRGRDERRLDRAGRRRDGRKERDGFHRDAEAYCPATCRAAGRPGGVPGDAESAVQPAAPRRTGCCRRAVFARRAWAQWARGRALGQGLRQGPEPAGSVPQLEALLQPREERQPVPQGLRGPRAWRREPSRGRPLPRQPWPASRCPRP
jgi:hypothetical protein